MFTFAHTSDWQMGMMARGLGLAAEKVRAARIASLKNLLDLANTRALDAILIAGDLFEDNQVDASIVEQVADLLNNGTAIPTYIITGNHDPATLNSVYRRKAFSQLRGHVNIILEPREIEVAPSVKLYACPLAAKNGMDDPTAWIPPRANERDLRIGLAHGTMKLRDDMGEDDFPIPLDAVARRQLDYLALGHWHSTLSSPCGCAWYCGTPETTKFGERDSGNTLIVKLTAPGDKPQVEAVRTGVLSWLDRPIDLDAGGMDEVMRELREWPAAEKCLMTARLGGTATPANAARVRELNDLLRQRFLYHGCDATKLRPPPTEAAVAELAGSPYLIKTVEELAALAASTAPGVADTPDSAAVARRAMELLHEAQWETRQA
jgi:hypothetical protein